MMRFAEDKSGAPNLYVEEAEKNIRYAENIAKTGDLSALRRRPPNNAPLVAKRIARKRP
jgi:hypothetical protein